MDDKSGKQAIEYGIVPIDVMASMSGLDFVRAIFARRLPEPPIMHTVEPFDCTVEPGAVVIHSIRQVGHPGAATKVSPVIFVWARYELISRFRQRVMWHKGIKEWF